MSKDNKGFTLLELIVGITIFAVVTAAAMGFLVSATKTYSTVNGSMNQRLEAQLAVNQISEYLIDCNGSVSLSSDTLSIVSSAVSGSEETYVYKRGGSRILFGTGGAENATELLINNVKSFNVTFEPVAATNADSAKISLTTEKQSKTLTIEKTVALRNHPIIAH